MKVVARFRFSYLPHTIVDNHETPLSSTCPHQPTTTPQSLKDPKPASPPSQTTSPERNPDILDDAEVQTEHRCSEPDPMFRTAPRHSNSTTRQVKRREGMENPPPSQAMRGNGEPTANVERDGDGLVLEQSHPALCWVFL